MYVCVPVCVCAVKSAIIDPCSRLAYRSRRIITNLRVYGWRDKRRQRSVHVVVRREARFQKNYRR